MQMCMTHWNLLRKAIDDRGLTKYVPNSGEEAVKKVHAGKPDPLMSANLRICQTALESCGSRIMGHCPLCLMDEDNKNHGVDPVSQNWIDGCCDEIQQEYQLSN